MNRWPLRGWFGLGLIAVFWPLNWLLSGPRTHWGFFPLWLGFCLSTDAAVFARTQTSLWARSPQRYLGLFLLSAPVWWLFEILNWRTENWEYQGRNLFTTPEYVLLASLSFSTVVPAVFGTSELVRSLPHLRQLPKKRTFVVTTRLRTGLTIIGGVMLSLLLLWPLYFFPLMWVSLFLLMDPINHARGRRSLLGMCSRGDWRTVLALAGGGLICGFFWEMWNYYSYPRWIYHVPFVEFAHIFEMPLLGYGGYVPFAMELYALYHFATGCRTPESGGDYIRI